MQLNDLRLKISDLPKNPGIYVFKDSKGKLLYIGKSINLKGRVSAYLKSTDTRIIRMIEIATKLEYQVTDSDIEALILESQLIKKHQPQFNIVMRDDKQYFLVAITDEEYPRIFLTHQRKSNRIKAPIKELIGPFTEGSSLKITLKQLRRLFPYCTCKQLHNVPCLNFHIGRCLGFCCLRDQEQVTSDMRQVYQRNIRAIRDLLSGKRSSVIRQLEQEMKSLGDKGEFEKAMALQSKIERVKWVFEHALINQSHRELAKPLIHLQKLLKLAKIPARVEGYDISNISGTHATGSMIVFENGNPDKNSYRKFKIRQTFSPEKISVGNLTGRSKNLDRQVRGGNDTGMLREVIERRLNHPEWTYPEIMLIDGGKGQLNAVQSVLDNHKLDIRVIALTKNGKHVGDHLTMKVSGKFKLISLTKLPESTKNLLLAVDAEAHRFAINYYHKLHRKQSIS
ncbi:MAG: GIY-YIG nuclease family protein [Patescibacteria group bacterium]